MYAVPSHQEKMISLACEKLNVTRKELIDMCPEEYYFNLMIWLSKVSGVCSVWEGFAEAYSFTEQKINALKMLKENKLYFGEI